MKQNKGSALFITAVLMFASTLLTVLAFSFFYYKFNSASKEYQLMKKRIEVEVIAQEIFVSAGQYILEENDFEIMINEVKYEITYDETNKVYEYEIAQENNTKSIHVKVAFDGNHHITAWKVWSE